LLPNSVVVDLVTKIVFVSLSNVSFTHEPDISDDAIIFTCMETV